MLRDVKIASIYEGANGIQAMDLVGRKLAQKMGANFMAVMGQMGEFVEVGELAYVPRVRDPPLSETAHAPEELTRRRRSSRLGGQSCAHGTQLVGHQWIDLGQGAESIEGVLDDSAIGCGVPPEKCEDEVVEISGLESTCGCSIHVVEDPVFDLVRGGERTREHNQKHEEQASSHGIGCAERRAGDTALLFHSAHRDSIAESFGAGTVSSIRPRSSILQSCRQGIHALRPTPSRQVRRSGSPWRSGTGGCSRRKAAVCMAFRSAGLLVRPWRPSVAPSAWSHGG